MQFIYWNGSELIQFINIYNFHETDRMVKSMPNHIVFLMCVQIITTLLVGWGAAVAFLGLLKKKPEKGPSDPKHRFAVVVCARNEEKVQSHLLKSLAEQDYPKDAWHV